MLERDSDSEFWLVFERTASPVGLVDEHRRYVDANAAAAELFGRSRAEIIGTPALEYIPPAERPRWERGWETFVRAGQLWGTGPILRADGSQIHVEAASSWAEIDGRSLAIFVVLAPSPLGYNGRAEPSDQALTQREREVVTEIALGRETPEIAQRLLISRSTVRTHVRNAMAKVGAHTRAHLVARALASGQCRYPPDTPE